MGRSSVMRVVYYCHCVAMIILCVSLEASWATAENHTVGDQLGWRPLVDYYSWVNEKPIKLGDTLVFKYEPRLGYSVAEVTQYKFIACNARNPIYYDASGYTLLHLIFPGQHYFISPGFCQDQMLFSLHV